MSDAKGMNTRKYVMIAVCGGLVAVMALLGVFDSTGRDMADRAAGVSESSEIVNVASSKTTSKRVKAVCRDFGGVFACAPRNTPKGSVIVKLYEDGSAKYANGSKYSSETGKFRG